MNIQDILTQMVDALKDIRTAKTAMNDLKTKLNEAEKRLVKAITRHDALEEALRSELAPYTYDFETDTYTDKIQ
jgi:phage pi2 protein 07